MMAGRVFCIHGIAPVVDAERFLSRNLVGARRLEQFLAGRQRFVSLDDAMAGRGDALTIDDATRAAADAAWLARRLGHAVTLFVNPGQVESGAPYHFLLLNALLDQHQGQSAEYGGRHYPMGTSADRQRLRRMLKEEVRRLVTEDERRAAVLNLAECWNTGPLDVGPAFATLAKAELVALMSAGVDVQNHGWTHAHHAALTPDESASEIRRGREWLRRELGLDARWFSVPFGDSLPHDAPVEYDGWFTLNAEWNAGLIAPRVYNRVDLSLEESASRPREARGRSMWRRLTDRVAKYWRT